MHYRGKGGGLCVHGKAKKYCRQCEGGGSGLPGKCEHGKQKRYCRPCGGKGLCDHNKRKSSCRACAGGSICEHGKRKSNCEDCGGSNLCDHGKQKQFCKPCRGSSRCDHGRLKHACKDCDTSGSVCVHGRFRHQCKECGGSSYCFHGKLKRECHRCTFDVKPDPRIGRTRAAKEPGSQKGKDTRAWTGRDPDYISRKRLRESAPRVARVEDYKDTPTKIEACKTSKFVDYTDAQLQIISTDRPIRDMAIQNVVSADNMASGKRQREDGLYVRGPQVFTHKEGSKEKQYAESHVQAVRSRIDAATRASYAKRVREMTFAELQQIVFSAERFSEKMDNSACQILNQYCVTMFREMIGNYNIL